jgi:hypothetical protein
VSLALAGIPAQIQNLLQDRTLERVFHDNLFPRMLYRAEARPEDWQANLGERMIFTRAGAIPVSTVPLVPGNDPVPSTYATEQWEAEARQFGNTIDTHMPSSYTALASLFLRNTQQLGLNSAQTMNRLTRDPLFTAYLAGEAMVKTAALLGATSLRVTTLNGFTQQLQNGRLSPVSALNPMPITFSTAEPANTVVGFVPDVAAEPNGSGVLALGAALIGAVALRVGVFSASRSRRLRVGAGATVDSLTAANILTLNDVIAAVSRLRAQNVPPHPDGRYHVHMTPQAEAEIFQDNHWQRLHQSLPDGAPYRDLAIGEAVGCYFYRNTENPDVQSTQASRALSDPGGAGLAVLAPEIGGEITNAAGVPVLRTIITSGGAIYEKYIDESKYITEAGVTGKIGQFSIINGGVAIMTRRIRFILRSPLDRLQQLVGQTWSWSGDFPIPSDQLSGDGARYLRAVVIEHA